MPIGIPIRKIRHTSRIICIGLLLFSLIGCNKDDEPQSPYHGQGNKSDGTGPVLVIGVDGLEWDVVLPLIRAGRMPNLAKLMERGNYGKIITYAPAKSPVIWTTIATGTVPERHGILDFIKPESGGRKRLYTSRDRHVKALWNILSDYGKSVSVLGWWNTFPVEKVNGIVVSQANSMKQIRERQLLKPGGMMRGVEGQVYPESRQDEMLSIVENVDAELHDVLKGIYGEFGSFRNPVNKSNWAASQWAIRADESYRRIALQLTAQEELPDLFAVYFGTPDVVGHRFWRFHEPHVFTHPPSASGVEKFGDVINDSYAHADKVIGEIVSRFPPETTIFVLSDHGMHAYNQSSRFVPGALGKLEVESGAHKDGPPGLIVVAGPYFKKADLQKPIRELSKKDIPEIASVEDITPTILTIMGIPVGRDMDGSTLSHLFKPEIAKIMKVAEIETHTTGEWLSSRGIEQRTIPGSEERMNQLRSLGYLGGSDDEQPSQTNLNKPSSQPSDSQ